MNRGHLTRSFLGSALLLAIGLTAIALVPRLSAQEDAGAAKATPLGVRQLRVERMMEDLEQKFQSLAATLQETEPARADKLKKTLNEAKSLGVKARMANIAKLLNDSQLDNATNEQRGILADVRKLLELLLDEDKKAIDETRDLEGLKADLQAILKDEKKLENESNKIANKDDTLANLAKQIAAVEKLIKDQENVIKKTADARAKGPQALGPVADAQRAVREETQKVAGDIAGTPKAPESPEGKEGEGAGKEGAGKEGAGKEGAGKEGAGKEGAGKEGAGKEGAGKEGAGAALRARAGDIVGILITRATTPKIDYIFSICP
jgi:hypothetical protein